MKIAKAVVFLFVVVALVSCVPPHALYLRNFRSSDMVVQLKFENKENLDMWMRYHDKPGMRKNVSNFRRTAFRLFKDTVRSVVMESNVVQYTIPAMSVVQFGSAWAINFTRVEIKGDGIDKKVNMRDREIVDNISRVRQKMELEYKWPGHYFFDIK